MDMPLHEFMAVLESVADQYVKMVNDTEERTPTYSEFEQHLIEKCGIDGKNYKIVDREKWIHYLLSVG